MSRIKLIWKNNFLIIIFLLLTFSIYLHHLSSDVYGGDVGDLVTASVVGGIAHPPGYPIFTILGAILLKLPFFATPAFKVGIISVVSSTFSLLFYYLIAKKLISNKYISLLSTSILAFSYLFWLYTEIAEVFALNIFFCLAIYYFAVRFYYKNERKWIYLLSVTFGLSLTNHHTSLIMLPGIIFLIWPCYKLILKKKKTVLIILSLFVLGLLPYIYVFWSASKNPIINWMGDPSFGNFFDLVTRRIYGTFNATLFSHPFNNTERTASLIAYVKSIIRSISIPVLTLCVVGLLTLFYEKKFGILLSIAISIFISGPFFVLYAGFPLYSPFSLGIVERFYLLSSVVVVLLLPFGILTFYRILIRFFSKKIYPISIVSLLALVSISLFIKNYNLTNLSKIKDGESLARNYLKDLPDNAIIFISGDTEMFNAWYVRYVLGYRPDVEVTGFASIGESEKINSQIQEYENSKILQKKYKYIYEYLFSKAPFYSIVPLDLQDKNLQFVPYGLVLKLTKKDSIPSKSDYLSAIKRIWSSYTLPYYQSISSAQTNLTLLQIALNYSAAAVRTADFIFNNFKDEKNAYIYLELAKSISPNNAEIFLEEGDINLGMMRCYDAIKSYEKAILIYPTINKYYGKLSHAYKTCNKSIDIPIHFREEFKKKYGLFPDNFYYSSTQSAK